MKAFVAIVDIGNTSVSCALADAGRIARAVRRPTRGSGPGDARRLLAGLAGGRAIRSAALCSVVPAQTPFWRDELRRLAGKPPLEVHYRLNLGIRLDYPRPETIGADRLAAAGAAFERFGAPAIVLDFGTALTFDVVARGGVYLGGIIAPGPALMTEYLAERTALLPLVRLDRRDFGRAASGSVIGKSTAQAILIGARLGYLGMVREIVGRLRRALKAPRARLCATGGYAARVLSGAGLRIAIDPHLVLRGIARIHDLNRTDDGN